MQILFLNVNNRRSLRTGAKEHNANVSHNLRLEPLEKHYFPLLRQLAFLGTF